VGSRVRLRLRRGGERGRTFRRRRRGWWEWRFGSSQLEGGARCVCCTKFWGRSMERVEELKWERANTRTTSHRAFSLSHLFALSLSLPLTPLHSHSPSHQPPATPTPLLALPTSPRPPHLTMPSPVKVAVVGVGMSTTGTYSLSSSLSHQR